MSVLENMGSLMEAISKGEYSQEDLENLEGWALKIPEYFNSVINYAISSRIASFTLEGEEYRDKITALDRNRRISHIALTDSVNKINRLASMYDKEPVFETGNKKVLDSNNVEDRETAADISFSFCTEVFLDEMERSKYHIKSADHRDVDQKLSEMENDRVTFKTGNRFHLDDFIKRANATSRNVKENDQEYER